MIKGYVDKSNVVLSIKKLKCCDYYEDSYKEFEVDNLNLKPIQLINIKGFKRFFKNKEILEFKDISGTNTENLVFSGITFKKESNRNYSFIAIYENNERIVSLNFEYLKPIFNCYNLKDINSLRFFYKIDYPTFFEININEGFLIAPCVRND